METLKGRKAYGIFGGTGGTQHGWEGEPVVGRSGNRPGPCGWAPFGGPLQGGLGPGSIGSSPELSLRDAHRAGKSHGEDLGPTFSQQEKHLVIDLSAWIMGDSLLCLHQGPVPRKSWNKRGTNKDISDSG